MQPIRSRGVRAPEVVGAVLFGVGVLLLIASGAYYAYGAAADARLEKLTFSAERPPPALVEAQGTQQTGQRPSPTVADTQTGVAHAPLAQGTDGQDSHPPDSLSGHGEPDDQPVALNEDDKVGGDSRVAIVAFQGQPQTGEAARQDEPVTRPITGDTAAPAGGGNGGDQRASLGYGNSGEAAEFLVGLAFAEPVMATTTAPDGAVDAAGGGGAGAATSTDAIAEAPSYAARIQIPALELDSGVKDMEIFILTDSSYWETPKNVVGHLPYTADPGAPGQGWYFGHLESPIRGRGNVFQELPRIPRLLRDGEEVDVFMEVDNLLYQYQVYRTEVVHQDDFQVTDSGQTDITLVTCYPRFHYDQRLLVTAALVNVTQVDTS